MIYFCCDERRREAVQRHGTLNGIDFLEVQDDPSLPNALRQRALFVHFIKDKNLAGLTKDNFRIEGGERIPDETFWDIPTEFLIGMGHLPSSCPMRGYCGPITCYSLILFGYPCHVERVVVALHSPLAPPVTRSRSITYVLPILRPGFDVKRSAS